MAGVLIVDFQFQNAMVTRTSFISVIEETKNLSLSDEKKRSPIHSPVKQVQLDRQTDRQTQGQYLTI